MSHDKIRQNWLRFWPTVINQQQCIMGTVQCNSTVKVKTLTMMNSMVAGSI